MRILVFGAGVIGITYAWQLSEAGFDVSLLVRKQRLVRYSNSGITISCTDVRGKEKEYKKTVFRPRTIDRIDPNDRFDLIITAIKNFQLNDAVPYIAKYSGNAHILFLGHLWDETQLIEKHFSKERFFYGFPAMVLGAQTINGINCYLFGNSSTFLGEPNGKLSPRLAQVRGAFEGSGLQPRVLNPIEPWIKAHFAYQATMMGPVIKAGSFRLFADNKKLIGQLVRAVREALIVARKAGIKADGLFPFWLFKLPAFMVIPMLKKYFNPTMQAAMEASIKYNFEELKQMYLMLTKLARQNNEKTIYLTSFEKYLPEAEKKFLQ